MHSILKTGLIAGIFLIVTSMIYTVMFKNKTDTKAINTAQALIESSQTSDSAIVNQLKENSTEASNSNKPDFSAFKDVKQKKAAFFGYLLPMVQSINQSIKAERDSILAIRNSLKEDRALTDEVLLILCDRYEANCDTNSTQNSIAKLLAHVDVVPPSLALAQAANESAWGTSRFALKANNYYGQWCFSKGCGLVPLKRNSGSNHEVRKFESALGSVKSYMHNLNTHRAYQSLRAIRVKQRTENQAITGNALAEGLLSYSERGKDYVHEIQAMIRHNTLAKYDQL